MVRISGAAVGVVTLLAFSAPAPANHLGCGDTITQDTTFDSDVVCTGSTPGISLGAPGVTIDLNGHLLRHADAGPGIENRGFADVTIQNGSVHTEQSDGIDLIDADHNTLRGLEVVRVGGGNLGPTPVVLTRSDDALIEGNGFYGWTGALRLSQSNRVVIRANRTGYFRCALEGDCSTFATGGGISLTDSDDNVVAENLLSQGINGASTGSERNLFTRNSITLSISTGLGVGGEGNLAYKNTVFHNSFNGIGASGGARVEKNEAFDNGGAGIAAFGAGTLVSHNRAYQNRDDGINVFNAGPIVERNRADDNGDLGIEAHPGVVDGGGNKASGNGNPAQCVNVACK